MCDATGDAYKEEGRENHFHTFLYYMKYLPFLNGKYNTAPGLIPIDKAVEPADTLIFQIDEHYENYLHNKQQCRDENIQKYYCENTFWIRTSSAVNWFIINRLLKEYPQYFVIEKDHNDCFLLNKKTGASLQWNLQSQQLENSTYTSLFDALCCQVQEDMAICQLNRDEDWLAAIHLCAPTIGHRIRR
ncbi:hypothetical protein BH10BAC2_BH10BAC2_07700 [soil metagenome]